jgi:hypothetical protein
MTLDEFRKATADLPGSTPLAVFASKHKNGNPRLAIVRYWEIGTGLMLGNMLDSDFDPQTHGGNDPELIEWRHTG